MAFQSNLVRTGMATTLGLMVTLGANALPVLNYDGFSYTGDVTVYDTLEDAEAGLNERSGPHGIPTGVNGERSTLPEARDAAIFYDGEGLAFLTAWYFTPADQADLGTDGFGNPNNSNTGFVQMFDLDGSSVDSIDAGWSAGRTEFSLSATGSGAGADEFARLWAAPVIDGAGIITAGSFVSYTLDFFAGFDSPAPIVDGVASIDGQPTSISGGFSGIFENTNPSDPSLNGFYAFNLSFQPDSWARDTGAVALFRESGGIATTFADVPAPAPIALLGLGLLGLGALRRRTAA